MLKQQMDRLRKEKSRLESQQAKSTRVKVTDTRGREITADSDETFRLKQLIKALQDELNKKEKSIRVLTEGHQKMKSSYAVRLQHQTVCLESMVNHLIRNRMLWLIICSFKFPDAFSVAHQSLFYPSRRLQCTFITSSTIAT